MTKETSKSQLVSSSVIHIINAMGSTSWKTDIDASWEKAKFYSGMEERYFSILIHLVLKKKKKEGKKKIYSPPLSPFT